MTVVPLVHDIRVDVAAIERRLSELWREQSEENDVQHAVTRAALWNVVAHTTSMDDCAIATDTLGKVSAVVPQRTIVVRADETRQTELSSWINANCHPGGGGRRICSEEIVLVGGGEYIARLPPAVNALLIPDMPVAVWWLGDLPNEHEEYVETLLRPADRMIVDSVFFDSAADLMLITRLAAQTATSPADLNWLRLEEWRGATASVFDPPAIRQRLGSIRRIRVTALAASDYFGEAIESLLYASWLTVQAGRGDDESIEYQFERQPAAPDVASGAIASVEIGFQDGSLATITRNRERGVLVANLGGTITLPESVTRKREQRVDDLIIRQLKQIDRDDVLLRVLPVALKLAKRL